MRFTFTLFALMNVLLTTTAFSKSTWVTNSSGELSSKQLNPELRVVNFNINKARDVWSSAGWNFKPANKDNMIEFKVWADKSVQLILKVTDSAGKSGYYHFNAINGWQQVKMNIKSPDRLDNGSGTLNDIVQAHFIFNPIIFKDGFHFKFLIKDFKTFTQNGRKVHAYYHRNWQPAKTPPPVKGYWIETCIWNTWTPGSGWGTGDCEFNGYNNPKGMAVAKNLIDHLVKEYKYIGITLPYVSGKEGREICKYLLDRGGIPQMEGHAIVPDKALQNKLNSNAVNVSGKLATECGYGHLAFQSIDFTSPQLLDYLRRRYLDSQKAGAISWRAVDYVWPWWGGPWWGYSANAVKRWRENLNGTDAGLELDPVDGKSKKLSFMDYFHSYTGYYPKPSDVGISNWNEYTPLKNLNDHSPAAVNNRKLYCLLYHYEWVKFMNEITRAYPNMLAEPTVNPESHDNGGDFYWALKCRFFKGLTVEWWGGAGVIVANYYNGRYYENIASKNHKDLILLGESAAAGGSPFKGELGKPHYWDNMANYLITYSQSGSVDFKAKHDQYIASTWEKISNPKDREFQSFTSFRSAWAGFLQCRNDRGVKPKADMLSFMVRPIVYSTSPLDVGTGNQPFNLTPKLVAHNYLFDGTAFPIDDAYNLNDYSVIMYTPFEAPDGFTSKLGNWLKSGSNRTLITHSFIPTRYSSPSMLNPMEPGIQPGHREQQLGMPKITSGSVKTGKLQVHAKRMLKFLKKFNNRKFKLESPLYRLAAKPDKVLVSLDGHPLMSELKMGSNRIIYLHFSPRAQKLGTSNVKSTLVDPTLQSDKFEQAIVDAVMRYIDIKPQAATSDGTNALKYQLNDGKQAFILFNSKASTQMRYGKNIFNTYQAADPEHKDSAYLNTEMPNQPFIITDMLTGKTTKAESNKYGYVKVSLDGWNMRGIYLEKE